MEAEHRETASQKPDTNMSRGFHLAYSRLQSLDWQMAGWHLSTVRRKCPSANHVQEKILWEVIIKAFLGSMPV